MMLINIKMLTDQAYRTIQKNLGEIYKMISEHPSDSSWLNAYLGFEPYETKKYTINDFSLELADDYNEISFTNAVTLYESLKELPRYILCNNRFWGWIILEKAYKQAQTCTKKFDTQTLKNLWFMGNSRRDLMLGVMSRYFFMAEISVDNSSKDKYGLLNFLLTNTETYRGFCYRNLGMIKNVTLGVLRAEKDFSVITGKPILKKEGAQIVKYASRLGSVMLLDRISEKEMYELVFRAIPKIVEKNIS